MSHEFKTEDYFYCPSEIEIFFLINRLFFWFQKIISGDRGKCFSKKQNDVLKCLLSTIQRYSEERGIEERTYIYYSHLNSRNQKNY